MIKSRENINNNLLRKYFNNNCTPQEKKLVYDFFINPENEVQLKELLRDHWDEYVVDSEQEIDSYKILGKVYHEILSEKRETKKPANSQLLISWFTKAAAILIIPLIIAGLWYVSDKEGLFSKKELCYAEIYSPSGGRVHFELPDGSSVWLNSNARLKYPVNFESTIRKVKLTGEGYFDVSANPDRPFIVESGKYEIKALGTAFNVCNEINQKHMAVTLVHGKVAISKIDKNKNIQIAELAPEEQFRINKTKNRYSINHIDTEKYTGWIDGKLIFRNDPFLDVIAKIEKWYNVDIELKDKDLNNYTFRATFQYESLDEVLKLIKLTSPIDYKEVPRKMQKDGTYSKKQIIFFKRKDVAKNEK